VLAAVAALERSLEPGPDFAPALATHAVACLRAWYFDLDSGTKAWEVAARASVDRAPARAPEVAETHLAAATRASHDGADRAAAGSLERALSIASTYAPADEYVGMLQCEGGRAEEGARRLSQSIVIDPTLMYGGVMLARVHALAGRHDRAEAEIDALE